MTPIPYQFSVLRFRESKSSGELVNIGLLMLLPGSEEVLHFITPRYSRLSEFFGEFDSNAYSTMRMDLERHFKEFLGRESQDGQQLELNSVAQTQEHWDGSLEDLLWILVPEKESCFQWSIIMSGIHPMPHQRFEELKWEFIERHEAKSSRERKDEQTIRRIIVKQIEEADLSQYVHQRILDGSHNISHTFPVAWQNGSIQVMDGISFDLLQQGQIQSKALSWYGKLQNFIGTNPEFGFTAIVSPPPERSLYRAYEDACEMLSALEQTRAIYTMDEADRAIDEIRRDVA